MIRAKLLPHNPNAAYLTSRGWYLPDGTFKPHDMPRIAPMQQASRWWRK